ncbi:MAG: YdcF family protein [Gammaproteobacteria bacterium]|jgi:uncharacterized SAM-binding protein YcdF (DUF218 family)
MGFETIQAIDALLLPPGLLFTLAILGLLFAFTRFGRFLLFVSVVSLYLLATPWIASRLISPLEQHYPATTPEQLQQNGVQALVLLGGGYFGESVEYADTAIGPFFAERLRYTAWLANLTGLPVIVSSGRSDAPAAARILETQYGVAPLAVDDESWNTLDNAVNTASLMQQLGLQRIAVVTHGWHMPRAMWSFHHAGVEALPAPMGLTHSTSSPGKLRSWYPYSIALLRSDKAIHEYVGLLWYQLRTNQEESAPEED